ncbi:hypothetical protein [Micromonospora chalcea]|uniref:hypothetical protein n=1 Tax=Micromonospora chalcea TaxID=1874 RepID=UPI003D715A07
MSTSVDAPVTGATTAAPGRFESDRRTTAEILGDLHRELTAQGLNHGLVVDLVRHAGVRLFDNGHLVTGGSQGGGVA